MQDLLLQEGKLIITSLQAQSKAGFIINHEQFGKYVEELKSSPFVKDIQIYDKEKKILIGNKSYPKDFNNTNFDQGHQDISQDSKENYIFTFVSSMSVPYDIFTEEDLDIERSGLSYIVVIELFANKFYEAQAEDIRRAFGTSILLLIIGLASVYFIFVIRRYYSLNISLQNVQEYISNVIQSMPNGLISLDRTGKVETINRTALRLLKLENTEPIGKKIQDIVPNCETDMVMNFESDKLEQQIECHLKDGSSIPLNIISSKINDEKNKTIGTVIILSDLRELKSLEKAVERSERLASLGRMAAGIAHEIRNPLSSIKGFAMYLRNKFDVSSENWEYASVMMNEVDRLNRVIQDLLNFAKPYEPKLHPIEIEKIINHSLKLVESELTEKKVHVKLENNDNIKPVLADDDLLTQVFLNLFLNAIDALYEAGILKILFSEDKDFIIVEVSDNGKGIKQDDIPKIFDPFFTSKQGGTGLGLAIVYRIIENHNGEIGVLSDAGKGTTFIIKLPKRAKNYDE
ncbi:MAG: PAS domain S-box protein [Bacteroidetes bacterium]|nr:PAS domain S-box protein [Bacteroidota bacterium]